MTYSRFTVSTRALFGRAHDALATRGYLRAAECVHAAWRAFRRVERACGLA